MDNELAVQMKSDAVLDRFTAVTGGEHQAHVFVASVLLAVKDNKALENCTSTSIIKSALRAATLRLSVDPALKQAYLVPYGNNATLQPGWKGLYDMAMRTGKYRFINVAEIKKGFIVEFDVFSGQAKMERDAESKGGWVATFELAAKWGGMGKSLYMSHEEIQAHKEKYAKGHDRTSSAWNTALPQMERKTVLRNLLQTWGVFDDADQAVLAEIEAEITDPDYVTIDGEIEPMTAEQMIAAEVEGEFIPDITPAFLVDEKIVDHPRHAEALMNLLQIPLFGSPADVGLARVALYRKWRAAAKDDTTEGRQAAAKKAIAGEVPQTLEI